MLPRPSIIFAISKPTAIKKELKFIHKPIKKVQAMNQSIVLTPHVINTINALPTEERVAIAGAIAGEIILGASVRDDLTPQQSMLYAVIKDYIRRDSARMARM